MASLYRKPIVVIDPQSGQKVKSTSRKWWGQFRDANGRLRRHPLSTDRKAAESMLNELVRKVEREKVGLSDPTDLHRKRPLQEHLADFRCYLENRGVTPKQIRESTRQIEKVAIACKWKFIGDISANRALEFLGDLRRQGRSAQTRNHYLKSNKAFTRWLVRDQRALSDPLQHVAKANIRTDRRHDRRALSDEEFQRLLIAARHGKRTEGITGPDRVMLYTLAAWTGLRKGELGSLTLRSLHLDGTPPTVTVEACYSKRRRQDTQVLHPELACQLQAWLAGKHHVSETEPLFRISGRVPGGIDRKTHKMIQRDLAVAREQWLAEAETDDERRRRELSDFLCHANRAGRYADFHSLRHLFITNLERAGVRPKVAQSLARHSDIRLTLDVYTHADLADQIAGIAALPGPPGGA